ncbi:MAG: TolC family protein [Bacteroidetes bacterium]|nr:TolC family protein [Bacteroidota bacterium]
MTKNLNLKNLKFDIMHHFLFALLVLFSSAVFAQQPQSSQIKRNSTYRLNSDTSKSVDIRERLVQLALQNPTYEMADHAANAAEYQVRMAKGSWLNIFQAAGNLNEFTINQLTGTGSAATQNIYFPKYNLGLTIPMDIFSRQKNTVKIAKENYLIAEAQKNDRFRQIRAEVLTKYEDYLLDKQMLDFQSIVAQDQFTLYKRSEKDFQDGIIKLEEFEKAYKGWVEEQTKKLLYQRNLNVIKLDLERIIGVKLEDVLQSK